jgi:hypothetical protein
MERVALSFWVVILVGIAWRLVRFGLNFDVTGDESGILLSVIERGYGALLHPLGYFNVSPPLFLWLTKFIDSTFPNEWATRLFPFVCGLAALAVFGLVCWETLTGTARWLAWAILSISYVPIEEGTRVKGYAIDLLVAAVMLWLALRWLLHGRNSCYLVWLGVCAPVFVWLSYTTIFMVGAIAAVLTGWLVNACISKKDADPSRKTEWKNVGAALGFMALAGLSAIALYEINIRAGIAASSTNGLSDGWKRGYAPSEWWGIPLWLLTVHTGRGFAWPAGENHYGSSLTFALWCIGAAVYWRRGNRWVWFLLMGPQALGLLAGFLHKYPYLQNPRLCMYLGPGICIFAAAGAQWLIEKMAEEKRQRFYRGVALVLTIWALAGIGREVARRYREYTGPSIRGTLLEASQRLGKDGCFVVLNDPKISGVFTYYLDQRVPQRIWSRGQLPQSIAPDARLALVVVTIKTSTFDSNALVRDFQQRWGKPLKLEWQQTAHEVLLDNQDAVAISVFAPNF